MKNYIKKISILICTILLLPINTALGYKETLIELTTLNGPIVGVTKGKINVYRGIPYAKPPLGNLRFAPPESIEPWDCKLDCKDFGNVSVQQKNELKMSEDSLSLNIWTPAKPDDKQLLPVYVFIHGGAFTGGSGAEPKYDGTNFAKKGIVVVTINYRLAALGFMASKETFNNYGTTGNWGILDQIKALEWVNKNIYAFGGDKDNITVGGESAGAYTVSALMLSPLAEGLFQKAILESGDILSIPHNSYYAKGNLKRSIEASQAFLQVFDAQDDAEGLFEMRALDADILVNLSTCDMDFTRNPAFYLLPVYDGYVIPKNPLKALSDGKFNKVKFLYGYNTDEGSIFTPLNITKAGYEALAYKTFGKEAAGPILEQFPIDETNTPLQRARQIVKYGLFSAGMKTMADVYSKNGLDVWAYNFAYRVDPVLGARHGAELEYVFKNIRHNLILPQKKLAKEMHTRWANFIKFGNPSIGEMSWPKYDTQKALVLEFNKKVTIKTMPDKDNLEFMQKHVFGFIPN